MKKGLVLEGGAMRGMFTCGVIDVLMENNIDFDGIIGVSAGAAFGCNYKSKQIGRGIRYNMRFCNDKRYCSLYSLITTGDLYGADFCYKVVPTQYDIFDNDTFYNNPMDFIAVCTDVETGKPYYKHFTEPEENMFEWFRASASLPLVSRIVEIGGMKLLDGGIVDSIPLKHHEEIGYDKNIVVLTQPETYRKSENKLMPLIKLTLKKYPKLIEALKNRHIMYNNTLEYIKQRESEGKILVIRPENDLGIKRVEKNSENLKKVYEMGRKIAKSRLKDIRDYLEIPNWFSCIWHFLLYLI